MKLHYDPETDSLNIELKSMPGYAEAEIVEGLNVDLDDKDDVAGFDIDGLPASSICQRSRRLRFLSAAE